MLVSCINSCDTLLFEVHDVGAIFVGITYGELVACEYIIFVKSNVVAVERGNKQQSGNLPLRSGSWLILKIKNVLLF